MKTFWDKRLAAALILAGACGGAAAATFTGALVGIAAGFQSTSGSALNITDLLVATVDDTVEFPAADFATLNAVPVEVDIQGNSIYLDYSAVTNSGTFNNVFFNGYLLADLNDELPDFLSASVDGSGTNMGLTSDSLGVDPDLIAINVAGLSFNSGSIAKIDVEFVPLPAAGGLMLGALALLAGMRRRWG